jgi:16S rRNA (cytosine967-C5)-methyltransferase
MKYFSHLNTAVHILGEYKGEQPFDIFIKQFFSQHKKYGSKDRKSISQLCYAFFRLGKALPALPVEERIITGLWLCLQEPNEVLQQLKPEWNEKAGWPLERKMDHVETSIADCRFTIADVFPWQQAMSEGIDPTLFNTSFFVQPGLFLRLRPGNEMTVKNKLEKAGISFTMLSPSCLALPNATRLEGIIETDKEAVIQDYSSQRVGELLVDSRESIVAGNPPIRQYVNSPIKVWDCCAASGGKSIMAYDLLPSIELTVSDVRSSILKNLEKRFAVAGIKNYHSFVADLSQPTIDSGPTPDSRLPTPDLLIADVPCTGSGTWSRTPEQLFYFDAAAIDRYSALQKKIIDNVVPRLQPGARLLYITCSVFKKENEEMVQYIQEKHGLTLIKSELLKGYEQKADTLFAALFTTSSRQ